MARIQPPEPPKDDTERESEKHKQTAKNVEIIQGAAKQMEFMNLKGHPILQLTEGDEKPKSKASKSES